MSLRKPRLIVPLLAFLLAVASSIAVLRAKAGPDVAADVPLSQPMSGTELANVQGFLGSDQGSSFIKSHPGADALAHLSATSDNLQALGALAHELAAGKDVPAAYDAAQKQALAELDARIAHAASSVADGSAAAGSLDAASKALSAYRVYGAAAGAKLHALSAAAKQARAQGHAQQVAQQLLGSLRSGVDIADAGAPAVSAEGAGAENAKAGAAVRHEAALHKGSVPLVGGAKGSSLERDSQGSMLGEGSAGPIVARRTGPIGRLKSMLTGAAVFIGGLVPAAAFALPVWDDAGSRTSYSSAYDSYSHHAAGDPNFFLGLIGFVLGGAVLARLMAAGLAAGQKLTGAAKSLAYFGGAAVGGTLLWMFGAVDFSITTSGQDALALLAIVGSYIGAFASLIFVGVSGGTVTEQESRSSGSSESDRVERRPSPSASSQASSSSRPSVGSTPGARPASDRPAQQRPAQQRPAQAKPAPAPAAAKLPSARNLDKRSLASWLSGRDAAKSTSAAQEIIRREVVGDFAAQFISILNDNPAAVLDSKTRVAMIDAMGNRRPNASGSTGLSKALLAVIDRASSPDEVAAAARALLKVGDKGSIDKLGDLVEQEFVDRYERGNAVRADVARGVMQHMENLRTSGAEPNGPAYKRINDVLSRRASNPIAANAASLSREVYRRNPRYVPSAYDRRRYNDDDDFWTAYWVSGVMGFPYPSNYGMMFYFMHQMNAAQAGAPAPTFWEIQRNTYDDYSSRNLGSSGSFGNAAPSDNYGFPTPAPSAGADLSSFGGNADLAPPPADSLQRAAVDSTISSGADASSFGLGDFSQAAPAAGQAAASAGQGVSSGADSSDFGAGGNNDATREPSRDSGVGAGAAIGAGAAASNRNDDVGSSREDSSR